MDKKKFFLIGLAIISFLCFQSLAFGQESLGLSDLQHSLKIRGARWQAGENSMTRLSHEERQKRLGLVRPVHTGKEPMLSLEAQAPILQLSASLDWRNNGGNYVTPIRDQGSCGSCWAFATTAALESNTLISNHTPATDVNLSEQVMVSCGGAGSCSGGSIDTSSNFIKNTGLPVETCYPYTATNGACSSACANWQSSTYRISSWQYVATTQATVDGIKNALSNYAPLVTTMAVYQDFFSYQSGIYHYVTGSLAGYHAVLIIGYDDVGQYFVVKNSWGTWWGESGFFRIAYSELNSPVGFGDWTIAYVGMAPACSFNVSQPSPSSFVASGGNGNVSVTTTSSCPWTAASNASWVTITSGGSGTGNGTVNFLVTNNTGISRTGTLKVAGQTLTITQDGVPCTYSINPTQQSIGAGGGSGSVAVMAGSGCPWTASSNDGWLTVAAGYGSGGGTVVYSVAKNSNTFPRTGTLTIAGNPFMVTQDGAGIVPSIAVSPTSLSFGSVRINAAASKSITISNKGPADLTILSVSIAGTNANQFRQTGYCTTVAPGYSCTITVTFAPTSTGNKNAKLLIYSNDPAKNPVSVSLTGKGARY